MILDEEEGTELQKTIDQVVKDIDAFGSSLNMGIMNFQKKVF